MVTIKISNCLIHYETKLPEYERGSIQWASNNSIKRSPHPIKQKHMPSTLETIKLYFVVPEEIFDDFQCQRITTTDKDNEEKDIEKMSRTLQKVEQ
nr:2551_t:CDS:2 [Entrophospora candida]CAG8607128.1 1666_t:CDS:2 [Entrophospora candida]